MRELFNLGISDRTIYSMIELSPEIINVRDNVVLHKVEILQSIGCSDSQIINIISSNPNYLLISDTHLAELFNYLGKIGFTSLNTLFDGNPYILDLTANNIKQHIDLKLSEGENIESIVEELEANPYLFSEI